MRKTRDRRRLGVIPIHVEVSRLEIDFLARRGHGTRTDDPASVSQAVSSFPYNPGPRPARRSALRLRVTPICRRSTFS
jgi:hypothetical protein